VKRALVIGGSGDIGGAICRRLAASRLDVVVHANRRPDAAERLAEEIRSNGHFASTSCFDVRDSDGCTRAIEGLLAAGPIQVLVNNAGVHRDAPLAGMKANQWREVVDTSLNGFYNVTQPLLLPMIRTRWGRIVNISSVAAIMGNPGQANYAAAKAGVHGATKSLAIELASRGITVNAVAPGIIAGSMTQDSFDAATIERLVPMRRAGTPEEVADLVDYLVNGNSGYLSGQIISINGAMA
jgi:3-oxoacyl-[acyl-carrier protein] reductase